MDTTVSMMRVVSMRLQRADVISPCLDQRVNDVLLRWKQTRCIWKHQLILSGIIGWKLG